MTKRQRLKSMGEKAETTSRRKRSRSIVAKALTAFASKSHRGPSQTQPDAAEPAEAFPYVIYIIDAVLDVPDDGVWLCCNDNCKNENRVKYYRGTHPFKYLVCRRCNHIFCSECSSSEILTPMDSITMEPFEESFAIPAAQVPYFRLCGGCGLTHRGALNVGYLDFSSCCTCGKDITKKDAYLDFFIGSNGEYQGDPEGVIVKLKLDCRLAALDRVIRKRRADAKEENTSTGSSQPSQATVVQETCEVPQSPQPSVLQGNCGVSRQMMDIEWPMYTPWPGETKFRILPDGGFIIDSDNEEFGQKSRTVVAPSAVRRNTAPSRHRADRL
jgi:hypothetical protein